MAEFPHQYAITLRQFRALQHLPELLEPTQDICLIQLVLLSQDNTLDVSPIFLPFGNGFVNDQILRRAGRELHAVVIDDYGLFNGLFLEG